MPNISAWPNDAVVCSLSQVLEQDSIHAKYFLSAKACAGIIRRAEARARPCRTRSFRPCAPVRLRVPLRPEPWSVGMSNCEGDEGPAVEVMAGVPAFGGENQSRSLFQAGALTAHCVRNDFASETFCVAPAVAGTLRSSDGGSDVDHAAANHLVAGTLRRTGRQPAARHNRTQSRACWSYTEHRTLTYSPISRTPLAGTTGRRTRCLPLPRTAGLR